jgi:hydroxyacylglutathione hydrolase
MQMEAFSLGMLETNCYIVWNEADDALVIDPSAEAALLLNLIARKHLKVRAILLTHAHFDHIGALPELARRCAVPVVLHPAEADLYRSPLNAIPPIIPPIVGLPDTVPTLDERWPGLEYSVLQTPGHSPGGVSFYFAGEGKVFSGDALFRDSVGRSDLPGGDWPTLLAAIRSQLLTLPPETTVYPGHGPSTTIAREAKENPFLK